MEAQSNRIFESLQRVVAVQARLRRNGGYIERDASDIVPGDIVILTLGSKVPADMRLILVNNVEIDEAILTGESLPVKKHGGTLSHTCALADQTNMAFMGTIVTEGSGIGVVVATGLNTEIGKIAHMSSRARGATPLQERMATLGLWISGAIVLSSVFIVIAGILSDTLGLVDLLTLAVAVAVAAIPEGLPAALSVVLAISAERILARDGLVRKIVAAETLGSTTVICTDKTGTLTEGKMEVEELLMCRDRKSALRALAFANEVAIEHSTEGPIMRGEATDQSKMRYAFAHGFDLIAEDRFFPRVALLGFDPTRKYIASLHSVARDPARQILFVAGAPEVVLAHSTRIARSSGHESLERARERELKDLHDLTATQGYRVIAIAMKEFKASFRNAEPSPDLVTGKVRNLTFLGFAVLRDPVRREVRTALAATRAAGMRVIMVTGDHMHTARAVAHELGFPTGKDAILTGSEIDMLTDEELLKRVSNLSLIARMNPEHKLRLVETLKAHGEVVAMTGDGVNDVPALKRADIGIALGSGTEAAKEASSLVLLDNSFQTIVAAIREGRIAFANIRKVTVFLLSNSWTELILILSALLIGMFTASPIPLPITAAQILWINLVADSFPNFALAFEPGERGIMRVRPRVRTEPIINPVGRAIIFIVGIVSDLVNVLFFLTLAVYADLPEKTIQSAMFLVVGLSSLVSVFSMKSLTRSIRETRLMNNWYLLGAAAFGVCMLLLALYIPPLRVLLGTAPLDAWFFVVALGLGMLKVLFIEFAKFLYRHEHVPQRVARARHAVV